MQKMYDQSSYFIRALPALKVNIVFFWITIHVCRCCMWRCRQLSDKPTRQNDITNRRTTPIKLPKPIL